MLLELRLKFLSAELYRILAEKKLKVSFAESCTGGLVSKSITDIPGASAIFPGGITAYSNEMKTGILGIDKKIIEKSGAVSEDTAVKMAAGVKKITGSEISAGITGIAGPEGGSEDKPAGTVCFGFIIKNKIYSETKIFSGNRRKVRFRSAIYTMQFIIKKIK